MKRLVAAILAIASLTGAPGLAQAQDRLPEAIRWEVIGLSPTEVTFIDIAPGRSASSVEKATVAIFRVPKAPLQTPDGKRIAILAEQISFSCLDNKLVRHAQFAYDPDGVPVSVNRTPMGGATRPGSSLENAGIWGCDHFNPTDDQTRFTSWKAALEYARTHFGAP